MVYKYMIPVYAFLVKAEIRTIESLPEGYQILVAEHMAGVVEEELNETN